MAGGLTDMEELLARVPSPPIADFLREALACYGAGAYRACVVLTFIAVFEDLRQKTKATAPLNAVAKAISADIEKLAEGQKPFESTLVDRLASKGLITAIQAQKLKQIIDHRNKAAHPSGAHASAEEARFVYFEAVDKFLSQAVLSTTHAVDGLLTRLADANFFPTTSMSDIRLIVAEEIAGIHPEAYAYLVVKVIDLLKSPDEASARNARLMLTGLSDMKKDNLRGILGEKLVKAKASDAAYAEAIMASLSADPLLLTGANAATAARLNTLIAKGAAAAGPHLGMSKLRHPLKLLGAMTDALEDAQLSPAYDAALDTIVSRYWSTPELLSARVNPSS